MVIRLPALSLVVLVGASGSGKSTFARKHFLPTEILSSDYCRGLVSDSENDQTATNAAFEVLHFIAAKRLAAGKLTVIDATNVQAPGREQLITLARRYHVLAMAIVLNLPEAVCHERNATRPDRSFGPHVVRNQTRDLRRSLHGLQREGFNMSFGSTRSTKSTWPRSSEYLCGPINAVKPGRLTSSATCTAARMSWKNC